MGLLGQEGGREPRLSVQSIHLGLRGLPVVDIPRHSRDDSPQPLHPPLNEDALPYSEESSFHRTGPFTATDG